MSTCTMLASRSLRHHFVACSSENCYADDTNTKDKNSCNYRQKNTCPLKRNYLQSSLIYQATVTRKDNSTTETYIQSGVCKVYYLQNISENEEDLLSYPKFVIKKETFTANHGSFTQDFHKEFSEHEVFHKVQRSSV